MAVCCSVFEPGGGVMRTVACALGALFFWSMVGFDAWLLTIPDTAVPARMALTTASIVMCTIAACIWTSHAVDAFLDSPRA